MTKRTALAGIVGPLWLGGTIATLTLLQYDFQRSLGWHPLYAPTADWPSGLALGPYGGWMIVAFIGSGSLLIVFANGLGQHLEGARRAAFLLTVAGVELALLGFKTDPTFLPTPRTWHGALHDAAFVLLGLTLFPAMLLFAAHFRADPRWRGHAAYTLATLLLAAPAFAIKGLTFYLFLAAMIAWFVATATRVWRA